MKVAKQYWQIQKKSEEQHLFESPEMLLQMAYKYFNWSDKHTCMKHEVIKSGPSLGEIIDLPISRPYSLGGFCAYSGSSLPAFYRFRQNCLPEFKDVIERIETIIETQQFEGVAIGIFGSSVINRKAAIANGVIEEPASAQHCIFDIETNNEQKISEMEKLSKKLNEL